MSTPVDLLRELTKRDFTEHDGAARGPRCRWCGALGEWWDESEESFGWKWKHKPDCPWQRAVKWLEAVTEEDSIMK